MSSLNDYERRALAEIAEFWHQQNRDGSRALEQLLGSLPLRWLGERLPPVPARLLESVTDSVTACLELLKDGAYWTYSEAGILAVAREQGLHVSCVEALGRVPLERLDPLARAHFTENQLLAAVEGAGTGVGGLLLLAADVPALLTLALRTVQQIGAVYGFDMRDPVHTPLVLRVLGNAAGAGDVARLELSKRLPREIAKSIARKKLAQWMPLAGAVAGAGFNYWFIGATARTAYMTFRERYLERKQRAAVPRVVLVPNAPGGQA